MFQNQLKMAIEERQQVFINCVMSKTGRSWKLFEYLKAFFFFFWDLYSFYSFNS